MAVGGRGDMAYARLADAYAALEGTSKRLEMTDILIRLFLEAPPGILDRLVYLSLGKLGPDYLGTELGLADKLVLKAVAENGGIPLRQVERMLASEGDIGIVAEKVLSGGRQSTLFAFGGEGASPGGAGDGADLADAVEGKGPLTVQGVFDALGRISEKRDKDSQSKKLEIVKGLMNRAADLEARYLVRTLVGKLRLGARDMTLLDAMAYAFHPTLAEDPARLRERASRLADAAETLGGECSPKRRGKSAKPVPIHLAEPAMGLANTLRGLAGLIGRMEGRTTEEVYAAVDAAGSVVKAAKPLRKAAGSVPDGADGPVPQVKSALEICEGVERLAGDVEMIKARVESGRAALERGYILTSDLGEVARRLVSGGFPALEATEISVGVPVRSMLAERLGSVEEILEKMGGRAALEYKYDGLRVQAHMEGEKVRLFSRNLEDITAQFPDLCGKLREAFLGREAIVDGECLPVDPDTGEVLPFQVVSRRRGRKYGLRTERSDGTLDGQAARTFEQDYPVVVVLFDVLLLDGEALMDLPHPRRRELLEGAFDFGDGTGDVRLSTMIVTSSPGEAGGFFESSLANGCEGVVAKSVADDSSYRAGARGWQWIKLKRDYRSEMTDTADLVVVGAFHGKGRRAGLYGALLMACRNSARGTYETVCKLGTGFTDDMLARLKEMLAPRISGGDGSARPPDVDSRLEPEVWLEPGTVLEVAGAEITLSPVHTCAAGKYREGSGLAIRFPRFTGRIRDDKGATDATTAEEIGGMYERQLKRL
jgi:DNA ligase-1